MLWCQRAVYWLLCRREVELKCTCLMMGMHCSHVVLDDNVFIFHDHVLQNLTYQIYRQLYTRQNLCCRSLCPCVIMHIHTIGWHSEGQTTRYEYNWLQRYWQRSQGNLLDWIYNMIKLFGYSMYRRMEFVMWHTSIWVCIWISVWSAFYLCKMKLHKCSANLRHIDYESGSC